MGAYSRCREDMGTNERPRFEGCVRERRAGGMWLHKIAGAEERITKRDNQRGQEREGVR